MKSEARTTRSRYSPSVRSFLRINVILATKWLFYALRVFVRLTALLPQKLLHWYIQEIHEEKRHKQDQGNPSEHHWCYRFDFLSLLGSWKQLSLCAWISTASRFCSSHNLCFSSTVGSIRHRQTCLPDQVCLKVFCMSVPSVSSVFKCETTVPPQVALGYYFL